MIKKLHKPRALECILDRAEEILRSRSIYPAIIKRVEERVDANSTVQTLTQKYQIVFHILQESISPDVKSILQKEIEDALRSL